MAQIILDSAQAQVFLQAHDPVRVCDPNGNLLSVIAPAASGVIGEPIVTAEEIAAAKRALAAPGPRRTTKEVLERLRAKWPEHS